MPELGMYFTKASLHEDGSMHWAATVTDTGVDNHGERVDKSFFGNAIKHSEEFGILPYMCVSHFDFADKGIPDNKWITGPTLAIFEDGERFKAKGTFEGTILAKAAFEAIQNDIKEDTPHDDRVRISMGFYDRTKEEEKSEATEDGNSRRVYKDGIIKHFALTRVPVLPRTEVEAWKEMSMTTKREDATSIVGEELAEELEGYAKQVGKSETEEQLVVKAEEVEMARKKKKKGQPEKVDKDYEYKEQPRGAGGTMAEEMWTATGEEAKYPEMDEETKKKNERERKRIKKKKSEVVEQMIKDEPGKVVLYSKDGSKVIGEFPYGEGKKYADKNAARAAALKREGQVQFFKKEKKSETEEKCEIVGGTAKAELIEMKHGSFSEMWEKEYGGSVDTCIQKVKGKVKDPGAYCASMKDKALKTTKWRGKEEKSEATIIQEFLEEQSETVEKAGRRLNTQQLEKYRKTRQRVEELLVDMKEFEDWAATVPEKITGTETASEPLEENPAIAVLDQGTPMTPIYGADFGDNMQEFAENVYAGITEGNIENVQDSLNMIAKAIAEELKSSLPEDIPEAESKEVDVEVEEVKSAAVTPLDAFNMKALAVLNSEGLDRRAKLQALQDSLNEVGGWLQKSVIEETPPSMGDIREVIVAAVREGTKPLVQENATLKARIEELEKQDKMPNQVPIRKSIYETQATLEPEKTSFSAKEVARRTMPPGVFY